MHEFVFYLLDAMKEKKCIFNINCVKLAINKTFKDMKVKSKRKREKVNEFKLFKDKMMK